MFALFVYLVSMVPVKASETATRGQIVGASDHLTPEWFKQSFLEIADDVDGSECGRQACHVVF